MYFELYTKIGMHIKVLNVYKILHTKIYIIYRYAVLCIRTNKVYSNKTRISIEKSLMITLFTVKIIDFLL